MIFTRAAWVPGVALVGFLCWLAVNGITQVVPLLVTAFALLALIGGGNFINGRSRPYGGHGARRSHEPGGPPSAGSP